MKRPSDGVNRRDLLRMRRGQAESARPIEHSGGAESICATDLLRVHRPGMGSFFELRLAARLPGALDLANRALNLIEDLETQLTVYQDDSEVSRLNATAHQGPVVVEAGLFRLVERAVEISRRTEGAYDITSGALSGVWGFVKGPRRVPEPHVLAEARARTGWHHLTLDSRARTIAFDRPGVQINLGSIGKGYAIDRAVDVLRRHWLPVSALVHGGQSSVYALGTPPGLFASRWEISLRNPFDPESPLGVLRLCDRALGTSGGAFQNFEVAGRVYGHILDPRTGEPATGPASVSVLAPSAAEADALSTAFYLLGPDAAGLYAEAHPEIGVIFVEQNVGGPLPRVRTFGLRPEDFRIDPCAVDLM